MNQLLKEEYLHIGTDKIFKELWLNIQMEQLVNTSIPYGGFFSSHQNNYSLCDWLEYKIDCNNNEVLYYMYALKSLLVKYKDNSKLLVIETENDYLNLKESGFVKVLEKPIVEYKYYNPTYIYEVLDFDKIIMFYDIIHLNPYSHEYLSPFSVRTMYALTPDCIEYYKPLETNEDKTKITHVGQKSYIQKPSKGYYVFLNYVKNLMNKEINYTDYSDFIKQLNYLTKNVITTLKNDKNNEYLNSIELDRNRLIDTTVRNIYREKYLHIQKKLLKK